MAKFDEKESHLGVAQPVREVARLSLKFSNSATSKYYANLVAFCNSFIEAQIGATIMPDGKLNWARTRNEVEIDIGA